MSRPLRVMLYDRSCRGRGLALGGLSHAWSFGGLLYRALGRIDAWHGAWSWSDGLDWFVEISRTRPIAEIQFWGHGEWGGLWIDEELLTAAALEPDHYLHARLAAVKARLANDALWWFRSCDVFGTQIGHDFARAWTRYFNCRAAGHTHTIMFVQSGLHMLAPNEEPTWSLDEGVVDGLAHASESSLRAPRTITALHNAIPPR
ncbi:MAG TPA: hypothetical protein VFV99_30280 [Kofleriaceae bacterium]|nr:hypothetical protein [Kofleriaceae bacterium]